MSVQGPPPIRALVKFPTITLSQGGTVYRSHKAHRSAGWRASIFEVDDAGGGRFDLQQPRGTLYVADDIDTAVREKVRGDIVGMQFISEKFAAAFTVAAITVDRSTECADLASAQAAQFGATRELETDGDYTMTRPWAWAFAATGQVEGIHYGSRFTSGPARAWALFGAVGACKLQVIREIPGEEACRQAGIRVIPAIRRSGDVKLI